MHKNPPIIESLAEYRNNTFPEFVSGGEQTKYRPNMKVSQNLRKGKG